MKIPSPALTYAFNQYFKAYVLYILGEFMNFTGLDITSSISIADTPISITQILLSLLIFVISVGILNFLIYLFQRLTIKVVSKTKTNIDDKLFSSMIKPFRYFSIVLSLLIAVSLVFPSILSFELYELTKGAITLHYVFIILIIIGIVYLINRILLTIVDWYKDELSPKTKIHFDSQMVPIIKKIISVFIYGSGLLIILDLLGIQIAPLLAGLGIGGLAVALALQDTLSNFFAGMYMIADKPIEKGDYISFDNYEGYVEEISWRNTKVRSWDNNLIVLPNSKLSNTTIVNYSKPKKPVIRIMRIGVSYDSDAEKVMKVLTQTTSSLLGKTEGGDEKIEPIVKFGDFKDSSIEFKIIYGVTEYTKRFSFEDKLKLEIFKAFKKNKIEIPYPVRTVYMRDTKKR